MSGENGHSLPLRFPHPLASIANEICRPELGDFETVEMARDAYASSRVAVMAAFGLALARLDDKGKDHVRRGLEALTVAVMDVCGPLVPLHVRPSLDLIKDLLGSLER